jgi:hypothetical protein
MCFRQDLTNHLKTQTDCLCHTDGTTLQPQQYDTAFQILTQMLQNEQLNPLQILMQEFYLAGFVPLVTLFGMSVVKKV